MCVCARARGCAYALLDAWHYSLSLSLSLSLSHGFAISLSLSLSLSHTHTHTHTNTAVPSVLQEQTVRVSTRWFGAVGLTGEGCRRLAFVALDLDDVTVVTCGPCAAVGVAALFLSRWCLVVICTHEHIYI